MSAVRVARCDCGHPDTKHRPKLRGIPANCATCKGAKALHEYKGKS